MGMDLHFQTNGEAASPPDPAGERVVILSPREKLLLRRFAHGKSDKVISQEIGGIQEQIGSSAKDLSRNFKFSHKRSS
jgi:hypothetical protein